MKSKNKNRKRKKKSIATNCRRGEEDKIGLHPKTSAYRVDRTKENTGKTSNTQKRNSTMDEYKKQANVIREIAYNVDLVFIQLYKLSTG